MSEHAPARGPLHPGHTVDVVQDGAGVTARCACGGSNTAQLVSVAVLELPHVDHGTIAA